MPGHTARKDASPPETVARVHDLLDAAGFPRDRAVVSWASAGPGCHSCNLSFANYPIIFSNGKGTTRDLAYASAVAEFVERLQCRADDLFCQAGHIHRFEPFTARRPRSLADLARDVPRLAAVELRAFGPADLLPCVPFLDVFGGRVVELPFDALLAMTGSSGMCAGNSAEEALTQGLCEVFERHALHSVDARQVAGLPTLRLDRLPPEAADVRRELEALRAAGIEVRVKDASLGGRFPVLALALLDGARGTCQVSFGSDPDLGIALTRCFTEAFQGAERVDRPLPAVDDDRGRSPDVYNCVSQLFHQVFDDVGVVAVEGAFGAVEDNAAALRFALERARRAGAGVYIRDCSLFGFPSFYVYVEGLSALTELRPESLSGLLANADEVRRTIFALAHAPRADVERCARLLFDEITRRNPLIERQFARGVLNAPVDMALDLRRLETLMLLECGWLAEARALFARPPLGGHTVDPDVELDVLARLLPAYAAVRGARVDAGQLSGRFEEAFVRQAGQPGPDGVLPLLVPRCHSVYGCPSCPCRSVCRLEEWRRVALALRSRAHAVDHEALRARLAHFQP